MGGADKVWTAGGKTKELRLGGKWAWNGWLAPKRVHMAVGGRIGIKGEGGREKAQIV